jgi:hypothetical protein
MSNPWSVEPKDLKIELTWEKPDGEALPFWIRIKESLTVGESRKMLKSISNITSKLGTKGSEAVAPEARFEWTEYSFSRCLTYLVDWSLSDDSDNKMSINRETLESLHQSVFDLIDGAIDNHETKSQESQSKKKEPTTTKRSKT